RRSSHEYLPWGGGKHRCLGSGLATTELTVMLARLLARGAFELRGGPRTTRSSAATRPHPGVRVPFIRRGRACRPAPAARNLGPSAPSGGRTDRDRHLGRDAT